MFKNIFNRKTREAEDPIYTHEEFWKWFMKNESTFRRTLQSRNNIEDDFLNPLKEELEKINGSIFFLAGVNNDNIFELIFTADGNLKMVCYVEDLVESAPNISNWKFIALKPAIAVENGFGIKMYGHNFEIKNLSFTPIINDKYPDLIKIVLVYDFLDEENEEDFKNAIYILLDNYIGELSIMTIIDEIEFSTSSNIEKSKLVPLTKLVDYLNWRQKEFIEKYDGIKYDIEEDDYSVIEFESEEEIAVAIINKELINWDKKASHPWVVILNINFAKYNPDNLWEQLDNFEDTLNSMLKCDEGHINMGRRTSGENREIFWVNKDFRNIVKALDNEIEKYKGDLKIDYEIFKDKYWQSLEVFNVN